MSCQPKKKNKWPSTAHKPVDYLCRVVPCRIMLIGHANGSCQWIVPMGYASGSCLWAMLMSYDSGLLFFQKY